MDEISIKELSFQVIEALQNMGMQAHSAWVQYSKGYLPIDQKEERMHHRYVR